MKTTLNYIKTLPGRAFNYQLTAVEAVVLTTLFMITVGIGYALQYGVFLSYTVVTIRYVKSSFTVDKIDALRQKIRLQLQFDGYTKVNTQINSFTDIEIDATR